MYEISDIVTAMSAAKLSKYCSLIIISHATIFIYYLNMTLAGILQFDIFV